MELLLKKTTVANKEQQLISLKKTPRKHQQIVEQANFMKRKNARSSRRQNKLLFKHALTR